MDQDETRSKDKRRQYTQKDTPRTTEREKVLITGQVAKVPLILIDGDPRITNYDTSKMKKPSYILWGAKREHWA